jgi:NAD(P)H-flavin reductase/ferredoxin
MSKVCKVTINAETIYAKCGDVLLDAALMNGIDLPHDCRSGYCDTCRVRVVSGRCLGDAPGNGRVVHACQTRVISDLRVVVEKTPRTTETTGTVTGIAEIASGVFEIRIEPARPLNYLPGQYLSVQFRGYPSRCYSPTRPLEWPSDPDLIRFHVRRLPNGRVSSALGQKIQSGHRVKLTGPFGSAYFRPKHRGRSILISSGTGFAPIWAIAEAAIRENPRRNLMMVAGARDLDSLYMIPALCRIALFPGVVIVPTVSRRQQITPAVRHGEPISYLPPLAKDDVIYAAGGPATVETTQRVAEVAGATCFTDPFLPAVDQNGSETLLSRAVKWFAPPARDQPRSAVLVQCQ